MIYPEVFWSGAFCFPAQECQQDGGGEENFRCVVTSVSFFSSGTLGTYFFDILGLFFHNGKVHIVKLPVVLRTIPFFCPGAYLPTYLFAYLHIYLSNLI